MSTKEKIYYLYKTTNLINGKYYYGMHTTYNLENDYLGSGKLLKYSIKKYGKENFKKEILSFYKDKKELIQAEKDLITPEIINEKQCLNLIPGGTGGSFASHQKAFIKAGNIAFKLKCENDPNFKIKLQQQGSISFKKAWKNGNFKNISRFTGKSHSEKTKKQMSESAKGKHCGEKNSQYGTCWIHNNVESKKIKKEELQSFILKGWIKGRKIKFAS